MGNSAEHEPLGNCSCSLSTVVILFSILNLSCGLSLWISESRSIERSSTPGLWDDNQSEGNDSLKCWTVTDEQEVHTIPFSMSKWDRVKWRLWEAAFFLFLLGCKCKPKRIMGGWEVLAYVISYEFQLISSLCNTMVIIQATQYGIFGAGAIFFKVKTTLRAVLKNHQLIYIIFIYQWKLWKQRRILCDCVAKNNKDWNSFWCECKLLKAVIKKQMF